MLSSRSLGGGGSARSSSALRKRALAAACVMDSLEPRQLLTTFTWDVGSGNWNTTDDSWAGTTRYSDGNDVYFDGWQTANRNRTNQIFIGTSPTAGTVRPTKISSGGGYSAHFDFTGGDIADYSATTPTGVYLNDWQNNFYFDRAGSYTFTGGVTTSTYLYYRPQLSSGGGTFSLGTGAITVNDSRGGFWFQPSQAATLGNTVNISSSGGYLGGNSNANWSSATVNALGTVSIPGSTTYNYSNLVLRLSGDQTLTLAASTDDTQRGRFNGTVSGGTNTLTVNVGSGAAYVGGPGNWSIAGLTKTGSGTLNVTVSNVCGNTLRIGSGAGKLNLSASTSQTVGGLWLGGTQYTALGTYGSTSSGATYKNDTYFSGTGVVTLVTLPTVSIAATDASAVEEAADPGVFTISRTGSTSGALTVYYGVSGTATNGTDYTPTLSGSVIIPAGQASTTLTLTPVNDSVFEDAFETVKLTLTGSSGYYINGTGGAATVKITDADLPTGNSLTFAMPTTAMLNGFRSSWDTTDSNSLAFDAVNRSLMMRWEGISPAVKRMIEAGHTISKAELVLPFSRAETGTDSTYKYTYRSSMGIAEKWASVVPQWHAIAYGLRQPWTANTVYGPTYNAYINAGSGGYGYWEKYGAQDITHDIYPTQFGGATAEVSSVSPTGRVDITAMLSGSDYGSTLAQRLVNLEQYGAIVKKWETYDFKFRPDDQGYEFGIEVGGRAIFIQQPQLVVTFTDTGTPPTVGTLPTPANVPALATTLHDGAKTALMPTQAQYDAYKTTYSIKQPSWMPAWQWTRVQEMMNFQNAQDPTYRYNFPQTYADYQAWTDEIINEPPRMWDGFDATTKLQNYLLYQNALPAPVQQHMVDYWKSYMMNDRVSSTGAGDWVSGSDMLVHPMGIWGETGSAYYSRTHDWRGNSSFYRSGFNYTMSTQNFNETACVGALLGGMITNSNRAMVDGRAGLKGNVLGLWAWSDGSMQESVDHYYLSYSLIDQKLLADFAPTQVDRMMARSALNKTMEDLASLYDPNLRRFISQSGRTAVSNLFAQMEGVVYAISSLSHSSAMHDLSTSGSPITLLGYDVKPGLIARLACNSPFQPEWFSNLVDEKPLPSQAISYGWGGWHTSYLDTNFGIGSIDATTGSCVPAMVQWKHTAAQANAYTDLATMLLRYGVNTTNWVDEPQNGIVPTQGGNLNTIQQKNKMIVLSSPNYQLQGYDYTTPTTVNSLQTALGIFNFQSSPTWHVYKNSTDVTSQIAAGLTGLMTDRFTINDTNSYVAIIPIPATNLGRDAEIRLFKGAAQNITGGRNGTAGTALTIESYNFRNLTTPLTNPNWTTIDKAYGGFVVEMANASDYASFAAFQAHINAANLSANWNSANSYLDVSYTSGSDTLAGRYIPTLGGNASATPLRRFNNQDLYLPSPLVRDSLLSQAGNTWSSSPLHLSKNGATLDLDGWNMGLLQTDPVTGTFAGHNTQTGLTHFKLGAPGGVSVQSDGLVSITSVAIQPLAGKVSIDYACEDSQKAQMATRMLIFGMRTAPAVTLNGVTLSGLTSTTVNGQRAWVVPLVIEGALPHVSVTATTPTAAEQGRSPGAFTFTRDVTSGSLTASYTLSGTASSADYTPSLSGSVLFPDGVASVTLTITPEDDTVSEGDETLTLTVGGAGSTYWLGSPAAATVTIVDNDPLLPTVTLVATDPNADEAGQNPGSFTITRTGSTAAPLTVNYSRTGNAAAGDFTPTLGGSVVIPAGQSSVTIVLTPVDDATSEGGETVILTLTANPGAYLLGAASSDTVLIADNDLAAKNVTWIGGDGNWGTSGEWTGGPIVYGDNAQFDGNRASNQNRNNNVAIDSAWVAPRTFSAFGGYGATFTFSGGDIRDYGATPTTMSITGSGSNGFIFARPFSFTGPVTISGSGAVFGFQPTVAGRLTQTLQLGGSSGSVSLRGNANADWSGATAYMNGSITIPGSPTWNYAGLNLNMTTDATMNITSSYLDDGRNRFNGVVSGNHILTLAVTGTGDATNSWCYIGGPGHWNVDGVTFNGANWNVIVQAPEIFGHTLRVNQSRLTLANASDTQTVTSLWIGGVQMTQPGTYGSSSSSADFVYDSYFGGAGVVRLVDPAAISATVGPVSPDPRTTSVSSLVFTFPAAVSNFDWTDLILSRDGGANLLNGSQSLTTSDNTTFTLNGLSSLTDKPGRYTLTLRAADSKIQNAAGHGLGVDVVQTWVMNAINGTAGNDTVRLIHSAGDPTKLEVYVGATQSTTPTYTVDLGSLPQLLVNGLAGDDQLIVNGVAGAPLPAGGILFDGGANATGDTLQVLGADGDDTLTIADASATPTATTIRASNVETITADLGSGSNTLTVSGVGVRFDTPQTLASLTVGASGVLTVAASGSNLLKLSALTLAPTAKLDLTNNALILDYTGSTPYATVRDYVKSARNGGTWDGNGLTSSTALANPGHGIAVVDNASFSTPRSTFMGESVDSTSLLIRYTWIGDNNLDGKVDVENDGLAFLVGLNGSGTGWSFGDYNYDGVTDVENDGLSFLIALNTSGGSAQAEAFGAMLSAATVVPDDTFSSEPVIAPAAPPKKAGKPVKTAKVQSPLTKSPPQKAATALTRR